MLLKMKEKELAPKPNRISQVLLAKPKLPSEVNHSFDLNTGKFQALGTVKALFDIDKAMGTCLIINGIKYRAFFDGRMYSILQLQLKKQPTYLKQELYWQVYPQVIYLPKKELQIKMHVISWGTSTSLSDPGVFVFRGIWQFIPQVKTPVISIYRNHDAVDATKRFKSYHLPVYMRREDISPYRYNPNNSTCVKHFIQALFKFMPEKNVWGYLKDLHPPIEAIPKYRISAAKYKAKKNNDIKR